MLLAMLSDRGANVLGSYDLTYLGRPPFNVPVGNQDCVFYQKGRKRAFEVDGMTFEEIVHLLQQPECVASVSGVRLPLEWTNVRRCKRLIEAYVSARYPVIMLV